MAYNFHERLRHNSERFKEIASETVTYTRGATVESLSMHPIMYEAKEVDSYTASLLRKEYECFAVDVVDLQAISLFPPEDADVVTRSNGEEYRVSRPDQNSPAYRFVTSERRRVIIYTKRIKTLS